MNQRDQLIEWLSDAHAMEKGIIETLKHHANEAEDYPDVQEVLKDHLQITERQVQDLEECLHQLGADKSLVKSSIAKLSGMFSGLSTMMAKDTIVKNLLAEYATEHFEIACYTSLIAAANALQEPYVAQICERNLDEEQSMADLLLDMIPNITIRYLENLQTAEVKIT